MNGAEDGQGILPYLQTQMNGVMKIRFVNLSGGITCNADLSLSKFGCYIPRGGFGTMLVKNYKKFAPDVSFDSKVVM